MAIHVALNHVSRYRYDRLVTLSPQLVRLRPAPHCRTPILSYSIRLLPAEHFVNWQQDPQSNYLARVTVPDRVREFSVEVDVVAEVACSRTAGARSLDVCLDSRGAFIDADRFAAARRRQI